VVRVPGEIKAGLGTLIGNAGEYGVMSELLKRRWIAALAPRNAPNFDIIATNGELDVRIRVKTKTEKTVGWHWGARKDGSVIRHSSDMHDFTVLVDLKADDRRNDYYIIPTSELERWITEDFASWVAAPGKSGRPHSPKNPVRMLNLDPYRTRLEQYKEAWDSLWT
jgi:hypothetical protein